MFPTSAPPLKIGQMIFSNLRPVGYEAQVRTGYQTIFHSLKEIPVSDIAEAETRLSYSPREDKSPKYLYFRTRSGFFVIGQIVSIDDFDEFGRTGALLAHLLFLSPESFAELQNSPFALLDSFPFATRLQEIEGNLQTGEIASRDWLGEMATEFKAPSLTDFLALPDAENFIFHVKRLGQTKALGESATTENELFPVAIRGETTRIRSFLRATFAWLPPELRAVCFFDSAFSDGSIQRTNYTLFGLHLAGIPPLLSPIADLEAGQFRAKSQLTPDGLWEKWLSRNLSHPENALSSAEIFTWQRWIQNPASERPNGYFSLTQIREWDAVTFDFQLQKRLQSQLGAALAARCVPTAQTWAVSDEQNLMTALVSGFPIELLVDWCHEFCRNHTPSDPELNDLTRLLAQQEFAALAPFVARWQKNWAVLESTLRALPDGDFHDFSAWVLGAAQFQLDWESENNAHSIVSGLKIHSIPDEEASELIQCLVNSTLPSASSKTAKGGFLGQLFLKRANQTKSPSKLREIPERWIWLLRAIVDASNAKANGGHHVS